MDAGIATTINTQIARKLTQKLDAIDGYLHVATTSPWYKAPLADTLIDARNDASPTARADGAWLVGALMASKDYASGLDFGAYPADGDWEMLFSCIATEIYRRRGRDSQPPPAQVAEPHQG